MRLAIQPDDVIGLEGLLVASILNQVIMQNAEIGRFGFFRYLLSRFFFDLYLNFARFLRLDGGIRHDLDTCRAERI